MSETARAFWVVAPGQGEIREEPMPEPDRGDVLVRTRFSAISRGTESLVFSARVPESEYERMRAPFQAGRFPVPVKYGYSNVGVVERGPDGLEGRHVFVLYPHQTSYVVPAYAVHVLPEGLPPERAVLAANMETAVNGLWDSAPRIGDRVTVVGAGVVGCLVAWLAGRIAGCDVELVDTNPSRAGIARWLGVQFAAPTGAREDADLVIHASGSPAGLETALRVAGFETMITEMSWYGDRPVPLTLGAAFHARRLLIKSSQVGHVASAQRARWDSHRRMTLALSLLGDPILDTLITGETAFDSLPATMAQLATDPGDALCHRIRY